MQKMSKTQKRIVEAVEAYKRGELEVFDMDDKFWDEAKRRRYFYCK